jgi:hypothetical protein
MKKTMFFLGGFIVLVLVIFTVLYLYKNGAISGDTHTVSFNPISCFSCYGCSCDYNIDHRRKVTLNEFDKNKCLDYKSTDTAKETVTITLEDKAYENFLNCVAEYSKNPTKGN